VHQVDKDFFQGTLRCLQVIESNTHIPQILDQVRDAGMLTLGIVRIDELTLVIAQLEPVA
jgi:hypothetical protein